jgi:hypothetical protein
VQVAYVYLALFAAAGAVASLAVALTPENRRRWAAVRALAVFVSLALAVPAADLAVTVWSVKFGNLWYYALCFPRGQNEPDEELVWKRRPGLSWRGRKTPDCDVVAYRTDEHGFRNPPGVTRADLVFVGDSVTEAGEVDESATFVRMAAGALGLSAVNLGTSGYGPQQELAVLKRYGLSYGPKWVVWQVTEWNDLQDAAMYLGRGSAAGALPPWHQLYLRHSPVMALASRVMPARRPGLVGFVPSGGGGKVERRAFWPYRPELARTVPGALDALTRSIESAAALCGERGVGFAVLYVPSHVRVLLPSLRFRSDAERDRFCPGGVADRGDDLAHAVAALCDRLGCPLIDVTGALRLRASADNRRVYVPNDPHLGVEGHDEVSLALSRTLGPLTRTESVADRRR